MKYGYFQSTNGIYVGLQKIPPNTPYTVTETDLIGIGWRSGAVLQDIKNEDKFVFKLVRVVPSPFAIERIQFQSDNELDNLETTVAAMDRPNIKCENRELQGSVLQTIHSAKRKLEDTLIENKAQYVVIKTEEREVRSRIVTIEDDDVINILSDSDSDKQPNPHDIVKKLKLENICEELPKISPKEVTIKAERDDLEYEAFQVKQEHQGYDDYPIYIDSESEDDESVQWLMRLSQSSPGKPFIKVKENKVEIQNEENSYSQIDDDDEFQCNLIRIASPPEEKPVLKVDSSNKAMDTARLRQIDDNEEDDDLILVDHTENNVLAISTNTSTVQIGQDDVDGMCSNYVTTDVESASMGYQQEKGKRTQMIEPLICAPRKKTVQPVINNESKYIN